MGLKNFALKKLGKTPGYQEAIRGKLNAKCQCFAFLRVRPIVIADSMQAEFSLENRPGRSALQWAQPGFWRAWLSAWEARPCLRQRASSHCAQTG